MNMIDLEKHGSMLVPVKGFEKPLPLSEVVRGFLRNSDYTNKTEALAADRRELASRAEKVAKLEKWFELIDSDPQRGLRDLQRAYGVNLDPDTVDGDIEEADPLVASLQSRISGLEKQLEQSVATSQESAAVQQLRDQFPDLDVENVKAYMQANNMESHRLVEAAKLMSFDRISEEQALRAAEDQKRQEQLDAVVAQKQGLPPVSPGGAPTPSPDLLPNLEPETPSWDEAVSLALRDLGQTEVI